MAEEKAEDYEKLEGDHEESNKKKRLSSSVTSVGKRISSSSGVGGSAMRCCQVEECTADLRDAKQYHRRHKVCEYHAKAQVVVVGGMRQRFCQQCSRFHELAEFDEAKRSCRRRLAGHNERRRKNALAEKSDGHFKDHACGEVDERERIHIDVQESASYKHFQIR